MSNRIVLNETSYFGAGARENIALEAKNRGFKKALLVTDKSLMKFGVAKKVTDVLDNAGLAYEILDDVKPNPTIENVKNGVEMFKKAGADYLIAVGGGSVMDTAKAIGIIINNPEHADVRSLEGAVQTKNKAVQIIAAPTTAGTAAEVTINYVITDVEKKRKFVCVDPHDIPVVAVIDSELMSSMPAGLTAATGMDALTHAIEGYITAGAWEMSDMFELKAIEIISKSLRSAVKGEKEGRDGMALGQYVAGMGFSNVGLGIVHSMAHPLGAVYRKDDHRRSPQGSCSGSPPALEGRRNPRKPHRGRRKGRRHRLLSGQRNGRRLHARQPEGSDEGRYRRSLQVHALIPGRQAGRLSGAVHERAANGRPYKRRALDFAK